MNILSNLSKLLQFYGIYNPYHFSDSGTGFTPEAIRKARKRGQQMRGKRAREKR